jgi:hypothetical protein
MKGISDDLEENKEQIRLSRLTGDKGVGNLLRNIDISPSLEDYLKAILFHTEGVK